VFSRKEDLVEENLFHGLYYQVGIFQKLGIRGTYEVILEDPQYEGSSPFLRSPEERA